MTVRATAPAAFHVATNRAGRPCVVDAFGTHDAFDSLEAATAACALRNRAAVRAAEIRAAREIAAVRLGALSQRCRVGLALVPNFLPERLTARLGEIS